MDVFTTGLHQHKEHVHKGRPEMLPVKPLIRQKDMVTDQKAGVLQPKLKMEVRVTPFPTDRAACTLKFSTPISESTHLVCAASRKHQGVGRKKGSCPGISICYLLRQVTEDKLCVTNMADSG